MAQRINDEVGKLERTIRTFTASDYAAEEDYQCEVCNDAGYRLSATGQTSPCPNLDCRAGDAYRQTRMRQVAAVSQLPDHYKGYGWADWFNLTPAVAENKTAAILASQYFVEMRGKFFSLGEVDTAFGNAARMRQGLVLYGIRGVGKTAMAATIVNELAKVFVPVLFIYFPGYLDQMKQSFKNDYAGPPIEPIRNMMHSVSVLVLDDANVTGASDFDVKEFELIARLRTQKRLPLIITTNATSKQEFRAMWGGQAEAVVAESCHYIGMGGVVLRDEGDFGVMF